MITYNTTKKRIITRSNKTRKINNKSNISKRHHKLYIDRFSREMFAILFRTMTTPNIMFNNTPKISCTSHTSHYFANNIDHVPKNIIKSGSSSYQGRRKTNEDFHAFKHFEMGSIQMVNDGHIGVQVAEKITSELLLVFDAVNGDPEKMNIFKSYSEINDKINNNKNLSLAGSCSIVTTVVYRPESKQYDVTTINVGDSRAIVGHLGESYGFRMGRDHNLCYADEFERVFVSGGKIGFGGKRVVHKCGSIVGGISVTRAFGDKNYTGIICDPEIHKRSFSDEKPVLAITACDGFFESNNLYTCFTNDSLWTFVNNRINESDKFDLNTIAQEACEEALRMGSCDNLTIIITLNKKENNNEF